MEAKQIYDDFLSHKFINSKVDKIDLSFSSNCTIDEFELEYEKFINFTGAFFIHKEILVTAINSYCYELKDDYLNYIHELYTKAKESANNIYIQFISEYIFTYYKALHSNEYKNNIPDIELAKSNFKSVFHDRLFQYNGDIFKSCILFYRRVLKYGVDKKITLLPNVIERIVPKFFPRHKDTSDYKYLFNKCLFQMKYLDYLIEYDYDISSHLSSYNKYIIENINFSYSGERAIDILKKLSDKNLLEKEILKTFLNGYVEIVNDVCDNAKNKNGDIITNIANIESLLKNLSEIKSINYSNFPSSYKQKIADCIIQVLFYKRQMLKDESYTKKSMKEFGFEFTIPKQEKSIVDYLKENIYNLYPFVKINFDSMLEESIKSYAEHPLLHLVSTYTIDNANNLYISHNENVNTDLKSYYDLNGREYINKNHDKLLNCLDKDYYEVMLRHIGTSYNLSIEIALIQLGDYYNELLEKYKESFGYNDKIFNNMYVVLCNSIIKTESYLLEIAKNKGLEINGNISDVINQLFNMYIENAEYRNGIMFINYILYDNLGLRLRNRLMHGEYINHKNYNREFIAIASCLVFTSYFINKELCND
ncbi:MAG: hypothetical protein ACM3O4_04520 [Ignavibacteriales bacterium]